MVLANFKVFCKFLIFSECFTSYYNKYFKNFLKYSKIINVLILCNFSNKFSMFLSISKQIQKLLKQHYVHWGLVN